MLFLLLLLACTPPKPDTAVTDTSTHETDTATHETDTSTHETDTSTHETGPGPDSGDTGEPVDTGRTDEATALLDPLVSLVVQVSWTTSRAGTSWVSYGIDGALDRRTPDGVGGATSHAFNLYGLPPETEVGWEAHTTFDDGASWTSSGTITTGSITEQYPTMALQTWDREAASPEPYFIGALSDLTGMIVAFDRQGRALWTLPRPPGLPDTNVVESLASTPTSEEVIVGTYSIDVTKSESTFYRMKMTGEVMEEFSAPLAHHMSLTLADGTLAWLAQDIQPWTAPRDGVTYNLAGDAIVERDPAGSEHVVFTTWDWREPDYDGPWPEDPSLTLDWTHANTIFYYPETDTYLLSLANVDTALQIDRTTGLVVRSYGKYGDFPVAAGSTAFHFQHDVNFTPEGHLLMTSENEDENEIFAIEYAIDEASRTIVEVRSFAKDEGLAAFCGGQARRLSNGNTFFNAGNSGVIREYDGVGNVVWDLVPGIDGGTFFKLWPIFDFYDWD